VVDADDGATLASAALAAMSVFENAAELRPDLAGRLGRECGLVALCVEEVREGAGFSERCAAAAEVLALLLQSDLGNREALWEEGGMEVVLAAVAPYRRVAKIATGDEAEMAANMFCVLCAGLLECEANKEAFGRAEGVELMLLFVRKRRAFREAALKALDFACSGCLGNTKRVFEGSGLGVLFAVLMTLWTSVDKEAQGMRDGRKRRRLMGPTETQRSEAERVLSVLFSLYRYGGDEEKARLTAKFLEAGGAKAGQLLVVYADRLDEALRVATTTESFLDVIDVMDPSEAFVMQLCAVVVACVCVAAGGAMGTAFETALGAVGGLARVSLLVEQFGKGIDEDCNPAERDRIFALANSVGAFAAKSPVENETPGRDATVATGIATGESVHADTAGNHGVGAI
jgi:beta-catenin-like protein 1